MTYSPTANGDEYLVTLTVDTSLYSGGGTFLDAVAIKLSQALTSATLTEAPGGIADWDLHTGGLSAGGCNGQGQGFLCTEGLANGGLGIPVPHAGGYEFVFDLEHRRGTARAHGCRE